MKTFNSLTSAVVIAGAMSQLAPSLGFAQALATNAQSQQQRVQTIKNIFGKIQKVNKGPYGPNVYQTPTGRVGVIVPQPAGMPQVLADIPKSKIFTAAYRSVDAETLANLDFYVGNLFTTNYVVLTNRYVTGDPSSTGFVPNHAAFMVNAQIAPQARSMARHMVMERFFVEKYPDSRVARGALQRGVADADDEAKYYGLFVQYLAKSINSSSDYLNVFEIQRRWNLTGDSGKVSMSDLRQRVAAIYSIMAPEGTLVTSDVAKAFVPLRNSIHNYMTPAIGAQLDRFISRYSGSLDGDTLDKIKTLRSLIAAYYKVDLASLVKAAGPINAELPANAAATLASLNASGNSSAQLESLSSLIASTRDSYLVSRDPALIHWILRATSFVQAELASQALGNDWSIRSRIALDNVYASGLLDQTQWSALKASFSSSANSEDDLRARVADISTAILQAHENLVATLDPALSDWKQIDLSMEGVLDDTLRASMLTELNQINTALAAKLPKSTTKYTIQNEGSAYGYLVYIPKGAGPAVESKLDKTSIPIFAELPLDVGVVAALITEQPQTPLSHISIKSKSRGTPNVYFPNASQDPVFKSLLARKALVKVTFKDGQMTIREATIDEANAAWGVKKSRGKVVIVSDLSERRLRSTKDLRSSDSPRFGAKASNYGEGESVLEGVFQEGLGIPFAYYSDFIDQNKFDGTQTIRQALASLVNDPRVKTDRAFLVDGLATIQARMTSDDMVVDAKLVADLTSKLNVLYPNQSMRFRSSTNSEDLPNFSGAGLYDSYKYDPSKPKKTIAQALKKTWASVLNLRAYDERELFEIPHMNVYMAILVSPAFEDELANGVAVTRNIVNPTLGPALYINTQLGEEAVTNPSPNVVPEETLLLKSISKNGKAQLTPKYLKFSTLHAGSSIMSDAEMLTLGRALVTLQNHFKKVMDPQKKNANFAIDAEFKLATKNGVRTIFLKQARPYIGN